MELAGTDKKSIFLKKPRLLYIGAYKPSPGWMRDLHSHGCCEVMFVKEGEGMFRVDDATFPLRRGDVIVYNPGVKHSEFIADVSPRDIMFLGISVKLDGFPVGCIIKDEAFKIINSGEFYEQIRHCLEQLLTENELKSPYFSIISDALLTIFISHVLRLTSERAEATFAGKRTYNEVKEFLDRNYATIDSIDDVCRSLYINKYYLTHLFKDTMGIPPLKYLIQKRMSLAKHLLATTDNSISDVAKACGYVDIAYFSRVFKKLEGVTPVEYRKTQR